MSTAKAKIARAGATARRWGGTVAWLVVESTRILVWRGIVGAVLALVGPVLQVAALVMILGYASWLTSNEPRTILGREWVPRESPEVLVIVVIATAVILVVAAIARWVGAILMLRSRLRMERAFGEQVAARAATEFAIPGAGEESGLLRPGEVIRLARRDGRAAGRVVVSLHMAAPALVLAVAATVALFWIAPLLTLLLLPIFAVSSWVLALIGRRAADASLRLEEATPVATASIKAALRGPDPASVFDEKDARTAAEAYFGRLRGTPDSHFVSDLSLAVLVAVILAVLGPGDDEGWKRLVAFLIGLRILQSNIRQLSGRLAGLNRFYPQLHRLRCATSTAVRAGGGSASDGMTAPVSWRIVARDGAGMEARLGAGDRLAVVLPVAWSPLVVGAIGRGLTTGPGPARRMLDSMIVAHEDLQSTMSIARDSGRWIVLVPSEALDATLGPAALPEASDLAFVVVHRRPEGTLPAFGESAVVAIDLVADPGPLAVVATGAEIDAGRLQSSDASGGDEDSIVDEGEDDEDE